MSTLSPDIIDRLYELLGERQNSTLTDAMAAELETLLKNPEAQALEARFEADQAALLMAFKDVKPARMPADSRSRLEAIGVGMVAPARTQPARTQPTARRTGSLGWLAAAAAIAIAAVGWLRTPPAPAPTPTPPTPPTPTLADRLANLLTDPGTATVTLAAQTDANAKGASGVAVWNNQRQQGFLRLKGLAANDPSKEQYQLWIFDKTRETYPIDGGVFDVSQAFVDPATGDTIVPMNAKLEVRQPAAIAVTVERPGGVVVTTKERLCLLGAVN